MTCQITQDKIFLGVEGKKEIDSIVNRIHGTSLRWHYPDQVIEAERKPLRASSPNVFCQPLKGISQPNR